MMSSSIRRLNFNGLDRRKKNYPSGGSLYESRILLLIQRVEGFAPGLYLYDDENHELGLLKRMIELAPDLLAFPYTATHRKLSLPPPQVQILIAADLGRLQWAYVGIPYRIALCNASILMYHGLLWAEALGFSSVPLGLYPSNLIAEAIGKEEWEFPIMTQYLLVGRA
jgi:SagB-type dehydrogenase family enzyme